VSPMEAALAAGEALREKRCVGHNYFWFRRYAIERALMLEDWKRGHKASWQCSSHGRRTTRLCVLWRTRPSSGATGRGDATARPEFKFSPRCSNRHEIDALGSALRRMSYFVLSLRVPCPSWVKNRKSSCEHRVSALPLRADMRTESAGPCAKRSEAISLASPSRLAQGK